MITIKSVADLNKDIVQNLHKIDRSKYDAIVGIPRSGMIPATLLATHLQMPLADVEGFCANRVNKRFHTKVEAKRILLVDDTVNKGRAMQWAVDYIKARRPDAKITRFAVWHSKSTEPGMVDITFGLCPSPRVFAWNISKHVRLPNWGFDFDGVLCRDPTNEENDDGPRYEHFLSNVEPLFLPTRPIGHIITGRLEKYRTLTEKWLSDKGVVYESLTMMPYADKKERMARGDRGGWKAKEALKRGVEMFVESSDKQARIIAKEANIPVWCTLSQQAYYPGENE